MILMYPIFYLFEWLFMFIRFQQKEQRLRKLEKEYYNSYDVVGKIILLQGFAAVMIIGLLALLVGFIVKAFREGIY